ncbi:MAG: Gfo/Idh/MocA family oxidoreductase [Acidobacteriota bacterium]|nr:Gfo/Idh/MocA family oxidoreductase [Acidobacteriota bacterium]
MIMDRRTFLSASTAAAISTKRAFGSRVLGANDRINMAVVGVRSRGREHLNVYGTLPNSTVAAVCDIDQAQSERAVQLVEKVQNSKPKIYQDIRKLLDDKDIDAISVATCNHWHALATVWACQAGKDVYTEKPACHNIFEGRRMVDAARKYNRIVQVGMQSRSMEHKVKAIELLQQGAIGKLYMAKGMCYKRRKSIGHEPATPVPPGVDFDIWLGPAQMRPFYTNRFHYNWHWFWDTGNGDIGNQGIHEMDIARWGLGKIGHPKSAVSTGGKYIYDDDQQTPNTQIATFDYGDAEIVFEVRGLITGGESSVGGTDGYPVGNLFFGSDGYMAMDGKGFQIYKGEKRELAQEMKYVKTPGSDTAPHMANFQKAMRSRNYRDLHGDILEGHVSAALVHMANTSYRLGGRKLTFDGTTEKYVGDNEANGYLSRHYRAPYVVPDKV